MKRRRPSEQRTCCCCATDRPASDFAELSRSRRELDPSEGAPLLCSLCRGLRAALVALRASEVIGDTRGDPSTEFLRDPASAPVVLVSRQFFAAFPRIDYQVVLGAATGWRTQAKLCVRRTASSPPFICTSTPREWEKYMEVSYETS